MVLGCVVTAITSSSSKSDDTSSTQLPTTCVALLTSIKFMSRSFSWNPFTGNQAKSATISKHPSTGSINQQRIKAKVLPMQNQIYERRGLTQSIGFQERPSGSRVTATSPTRSKKSVEIEVEADPFLSIKRQEERRPEAVGYLFTFSSTSSSPSARY